MGSDPKTEAGLIEAIAFLRSVVASGERLSADDDARLDAVVRAARLVSPADREGPDLEVLARALCRDAQAFGYDHGPAPTLEGGFEFCPRHRAIAARLGQREDSPLDAERLARALVTVTREQAGEPHGEGWPGYVSFGKPRDVAVVLNVNELAAAIAAEYARLTGESR